MTALALATVRHATKALLTETNEAKIARHYEVIDAAYSGAWIAGTDEPVTTNGVYRYQYSWNPSLGCKGWYNLDTDIVEMADPYAIR